MLESLGSALTSEKTEADDKAKTAQVALLYTESLTDVLGSGRKGTAKGTKIGLMGDEQKNEFSKAGRMSGERIKEKLERRWEPEKKKSKPRVLTTALVSGGCPRDSAAFLSRLAAVTGRDPRPKRRGPIPRSSHDRASDWALGDGRSR